LTAAELSIDAIVGDPSQLPCRPYGNIPAFMTMQNKISTKFVKAKQFQLQKFKETFYETIKVIFNGSISNYVIQFQQGY